MWLVLAASYDAAAHWAYEGLKARGLTPIEFVSAEALVNSLRWEHRLGEQGTQTHTTLADLRNFYHRDITGVLNRLSYLPDGTIATGRPEDRDYAKQEFYAFITSWLYALPGPVLNQPTPQGLGGAWRHPSEWAMRAVRAGLPIPEYRLSSRTPDQTLSYQARLIPATTNVEAVFVIGDRVVGNLPQYHDGCRELANRADSNLLGIEFAPNVRGHWTFIGASTLPELHLAKEAGLDALCTALSQNVEVTA